MSFTFVFHNHRNNSDLKSGRSTLRETKCEARQLSDKARTRSEHGRKGSRTVGHDQQRTLWNERGINVPYPARQVEGQTNEHTDANRRKLTRTPLAVPLPAFGGWLRAPPGSTPQERGRLQQQDGFRKTQPGPPRLPSRRSHAGKRDRLRWAVQQAVRAQIQACKWRTAAHTDCVQCCVRPAFSTLPVSSGVTTLAPDIATGKPSESAFSWYGSLRHGLLLTVH